MIRKQMKAWKVIRIFLRTGQTKEIPLNFLKRNPELFDIPVFIRRQREKKGLFS